MFSVPFNKCCCTCFELASLILIDCIMLWLNIPVEELLSEQDLIYSLSFVGFRRLLYTISLAPLKAFRKFDSSVSLFRRGNGNQYYMNLVLVVVYPLGVAGTAWATIIAQSYSELSLGCIPSFTIMKCARHSVRFNVKKRKS